VKRWVFPKMPHQGGVNRSAIGRLSYITRRAFLAATGVGFLSGRVSSHPMRHVVLLGDSVFDNAAYVGGGPDVIAQMREALPAGKATLCAVDGAVIADVGRQLARLPDDATHLVVSVGGNDALRESGILDRPARSATEVLMGMADAQTRFRTSYREMLDDVLARKLPVAVCTIYDPRYPDPIRRRLATTALAVLNDVIMREAFDRGMPLIDLRLISNEDSDFANPIEPSVAGGRKIARAVAQFAMEKAADTQVFAR
jgi:hypothetical protein